jgi:hypothetical protein
VERHPFRDEKLRRFCLRRFRLFHCSKIEIKKRIAFVALIFILLAQTKDFLEDLHIEPFPFGLREDFFFPLVKCLDLLIDMLNAFDNRQNAIARNAYRVGHVVPFIGATTRYGSESN